MKWRHTVGSIKGSPGGPRRLHIATHVTCARGRSIPSVFLWMGPAVVKHLPPRPQPVSPHDGALLLVAAVPSACALAAPDARLSNSLACGFSAAECGSLLGTPSAL